MCSFFGEIYSNSHFEFPNPVHGMYYPEFDTFYVALQYQSNKMGLYDPFWT